MFKPLKKVFSPFASNPVQYHDGYFRIFAILLFVSFMAVHGRLQPLWWIITQPGFFRIYLISCGIAFVVIHWVYLCTMFLDKYYPWEKNEELRTVYQALICIVAPVVISMFLASLHYQRMGYSIFETRHFSLYLGPQIFGFVILSGYYYIRYKMIRKRLAEKPSESQPVQKPETKSEEKVEHVQPAKSEQILLSPEINLIALDTDVVFVEKQENCYIVYKNHEQKEVWLSNWEECLKRLNSANYITVYNEYIIKSDNIKNIEADSSRRINFELSIPAKRKVIVSQGKSRELKNTLKFQELLAKHKLIQKGKLPI